MHTVLAIAIGPNDMTVATHDVTAAVGVSVMDRSVVGTSVRIGDDARVARATRRVGDPVPIFLADGRSATGAKLVAGTIAEIAGRARYGAIVVVYPATWTRHAVATLDGELKRHAVAAVLVDRPSVADRWLRSIGTISGGPQAVVAEVGEEDTVVSCSRAESGRTGVVTEPGSDPFGAVSVDRVLLSHIIEELRRADSSFDPDDPANWNDVHDLAQRTSAARRRLDTVPVADLDVSLRGGRRNVRILRSEFEQLIATDVMRMASRVAGTVAQFREPVQSVVVHGAAASIPMVAESLSVRTRIPVAVATAPESVVIKGAVLWASSLVSMPTTSEMRVPTAPDTKRRSMWTRGRVWIASGAAAAMLVFGGFAAAQSVAAPDITGPAPVPTMHTVGTGTAGP